MDTANTEKKARKYRQYSEALKLEVVKLVSSGKLSRSAACSRYGIKGKSTIPKWISKYQGAKMKKAKRQNLSVDAQIEIAKLLEDKKVLERALLKSTVQVSCLEAIIEAAEARYGTDLKKDSTQK